MKKLITTIVGILSITASLSFVTAQVKLPPQYAKIDITEAGAPEVGNATELNYACSGATSMVVTKSYTYNNTPVEIFSTTFSSNIVYEKVLPAELGTKYDLVCKTDSKTSMTDSYKTPDFLPQTISISSDKTTLNAGEFATIKAMTFNGAFDYCEVYVNSNKIDTLTGNMNISSKVISFESVPGGTNDVMYKCRYSNNTVGTTFVSSNVLQISRSGYSTGSDVVYCSILDVDGDGKVQALVDGVMITRALNSNVLDANITNAVNISSSATRKTGTEIRAFVNANLSKYDVDGDGRSLAAIDGVLITRYMLGITNSELLTGVPVAAGVTSDQVVARAKGICLTSPNPGICTAVYKPVCGQPPMQACKLGMACPQVMPQPQTYSNKCQMEAAGATYLYDGECQKPITSDPVDCPKGTFTNPSCVCPTGTTMVPVESGTRVQSYMCSDSSVTIAACPTGVFSIKDTCQCPTGQNLTRVGQDANGRDLYTCASSTNPKICTDVYKPVCGMPKVCNSTTKSCLDVMPQPQTYSNKCQMEAAEATYLYDGACNFEQTNKPKLIKSSTTPPTIPTIPNTDVDNGDSAPQVCTNLSANMRFSSRDSFTAGDVSKLQTFLITSGYMSGNATGYFGNATLAAVKNFQSANSLVVSGIVGQYTRAKISTMSCQSGDTSAQADEPLPLGLPNVTSAATVQPVQDTVTVINMTGPSVGFKLNPVKVVNNTKFVAEFSTDAFKNEAQYYVKLVYKNQSRQCILTAPFTPTTNKTYKLERTSDSVCILGGTIGDLSQVERLEIAKQ